MYPLMQFRGKAEELGDLAITCYDRRCDSPTRHAIDTWESEGGGSAAAIGGFDSARTALSDIDDWVAIITVVHYQATPTGTHLRTTMPRYLCLPMKRIEFFVVSGLRL